MTTAAGIVRWTMLKPRNAALTLVHSAAGKAGFRTEVSDAVEIRVAVPRSLRRRRRSSHLRGRVCSSARGTEIEWRADEPGAGHLDHLISIEENLPEGVMYYHALVAAAARVGLEISGRRDLRRIVDALEQDETVRSVGAGHFDENPVFVVLTGRRFLVMEKHTWTEPLLDAPYGRISALSLGKKRSGETLRIAASETEMEISRLGHSEGHGIATSFRGIRHEQARTLPILPASTSLQSDTQKGSAE